VSVVTDVGIGGGTNLRPPASMDEAPTRVRRMVDAFAEALARHPAAVRDEAYLFAGRPVRLRIVGAGFAERTHRAFGHLRPPVGEAASPVLTVDLWDETETGVAGLEDAASTDLDRQWIACDGQLTASPDGRYVSFRYRDSVTVLDRRGGRMIGCRRDGSHLSGGEYSKPLLLMLSIWYHDRGVQMLHTGLIAHDGAGVLIPGESGTGKSTTSIAGVAQGLGFLGDDFVGLERRADGSFLGHSIYNTACVVRDNLLGRFPDLRTHAVQAALPEEEKPILFLSEIFPDRVRRTVPIRAVVLLRVGNERTQLRRARPAEALRRFAASSLHTVVPRPGREALQMIGELAARVPAYWLLLGPDLRDIPAGIARIAADAAGAGGENVC
jgi:hypothetical protein